MSKYLYAIVAVIVSLTLGFLWHLGDKKLAENAAFKQGQIHEDIIWNERITKANADFEKLKQDQERNIQDIALALNNQVNQERNRADQLEEVIRALVEDDKKNFNPNCPKPPAISKRVRDFLAPIGRN